MDAQLDLAIRQIEFAREYTLRLLDDVEDDLWYEIPNGSVTHVAWQVGHLAMAEYGLCLFRQRGRESIDRELMPSQFRKRFSRGSTPQPGAEGQPTPVEIRNGLAAIHSQAMAEVATFSSEHLAEEIDRPYAIYPTKLGALLFCSQHEMLHSGQIGLLRRMLGKPILSA